MTRRLRPLALAVAASAALSVLAACGTSSGGSGSDGAKATTTEAPTTTAAPSTTTTTVGTSTTTGGSTTTAATPSKLPACQALLQEYTNRFTPDDLRDISSFFREYAPLMPAKVAAASNRIADAYDAAGDLTKLNMADTDLTADAQTFSDWLSSGCPPG